LNHATKAIEIEEIEARVAALEQAASPGGAALCWQHLAEDGAPGMQVNSVGNRRRRWNGDGCGYRPPLAAFGI